MRKRKLLVSGIVLIIALVVFALLFMKSLGAVKPYLFTPSTNLSAQEIYGLKLYGNIQSKSFKKSFGSSVLVNQNKSLYDERLWHKGLLTYSAKSAKNKGRIMGYMLVEITEVAGFKLPPYLNPQRTAKGIRLGDTNKQVIAKYGKKYYHFTGSDGDKIIGYIDHHKHIKLEFSFDKNNLVHVIRLADQNVN